MPRRRADGPRAERWAATLLLAAALALAMTGAGLGQDRHKSNKPKLPPGMDPGGVAVALIGSGVDYTRAPIALRLARDGEGDLIGLDLVDRDTRPYERDGATPAPAGAQSGTATAGFLLGEASPLRLVPVRVAFIEPRSFTAALAFISRTPARIALAARGADRLEDLQALHASTATHAGILVVLPAGDGGRDLDASTPGKSLSGGPANLLLVTASDAAGNLHAAADHGVRSVDIAAPAETSALAAARIAALAARLSAREPKLDAAALKARIVALAKPLPERERRRTRHGWVKP